MTIAFWCVLIAALTPYVFAGVAKFGADDPYDNNAPRDFLERQKGHRQRANWAQMNSFEAFPAFAAAVIIAHLAGVAKQGAIDGLAVAFLVCRGLYGLAYIYDKAALRSLFWIGGIGCVIALFVLSA